ncbi:MAG TPA: nucleotidyltransferase domain-containing protein [Bryobacteraceae bacterium]|jgi:uncharacterized protein|nr:nucleotidyltransferase domain-containing protein [Bryobacteraceae bacterium]
MLTLDTLRREKKAEILHRADAHGCRNVRVFGSVATGENRPDSDVDFLVDLDQGRGLLDLGGLLSDLHDLFGVEVDVVEAGGIHPYIGCLPRSRITRIMKGRSVVTLDTLRRERGAEILRLSEARGGPNVCVFGSVVRGDNGQDSDVDFLVEFEERRTLLDLIGLKLDLQDLLGATVDVVTPNSLRYIRERALAEVEPL